MSGVPYGPNQGFAVPPMPPSPPPAPPDGWRAAAVAVLNLSGLGLGYALVRRWIPMAACWTVTVVLLLVALPADADGVPGAALAVYTVLLLLAAAHGAIVGRRTRLTWPGRAPLALLLGVLLLAVPAGGAAWYDDAHDEAVQQALLDRLDRADHLVTAAGRRNFGTARSDYTAALDVYRDLAVKHSVSRAAGQVPDRMRTYYTTVGAAYGHQRYCEAIEPLKYLRTVPRTMPENELGSLVQWPDDRLATSLYECGRTGLTAGRDDWVPHFGDLLNTFPRSAPAAEVAPAVDAAVKQAEKDVNGGQPCTAVERLRTLNTRIGNLAAAADHAPEGLAKSADRAGGSGDAGEYACGVDQYKDGDFDAAQKTMEQYVSDNKHGGNRDRAKKIAIGAEVAQTLPAAGKKLPTTASGGSISVTVKNDSPDDVTVLYTGPVTGSFTLEGCGSCTSYSLAGTLMTGFKPCSDSGRHYPQRTLSLPVGTTYFVHKPHGGSTATPASDTARLRSGYIYTECAYTTRTLGSGT
ncbi:hypothetical protein J2Z21_000100 [Streptomyces griseochromogenes]|uniref:Uncharacterized protein n=1 Tax=Streptomyces griseochromogenes TaxID=68214 RepID=A0A1B1B1B1_9ACTN|nr:hypothetical protein [Streptomyces griseochromogenes]ANP52600.1 hypothetical protein AVL59_26410 [Streptomyces griseochromogenes]MBP2047178.1 hypothetical protein [Streptomyces griseochromogenes]